LCSRGIIARFRHLCNDLQALLPHSRKESKFGQEKDLRVINEICEMKHCNNCIFFECRKRKDLYIWLVRAPHGPSVKLHGLNVHTMSELKFSGNGLKGSRPIIFFDKTFDSAPHYQVIKELLTQTFSTPYMHPRSKPFIDHIISFYILDGKIWFRNYQITEEQIGTRMNKTLREIGPRFAMNPVRILSGSFSGPAIWENPDFVSPNKLRAIALKEDYQSTASKPARLEQTKIRRESYRMPVYNPLLDMYKDTEIQQRLRKIDQQLQEKRKSLNNNNAPTPIDPNAALTQRNTNNEKE